MHLRDHLWLCVWIVAPKYMPHLRAGVVPQDIRTAHY